jgi:hypothetical protein
MPADLDEVAVRAVRALDQARANKGDDSAGTDDRGDDR